METGSTPIDTLAAGLATDLERIVGLFRSLVPPSSGLSMTAAVTLASLERLARSG